MGFFFSLRKTSWVFCRFGPNSFWNVCLPFIANFASGPEQQQRSEQWKQRGEFPWQHFSLWPLLPRFHLTAPCLCFPAHPWAQSAKCGGLIQLPYGGSAPAANTTPALQTLHAPNLWVQRSTLHQTFENAFWMFAAAYENRFAMQ